MSSDPVASASRRPATFVDAVLAGLAEPGDLDQWVEAWHRSTSVEDLHTWLGLTFVEYASLGSGDHQLDEILHARRSATNSRDAVDASRDVKAGARMTG